MRTELFVSRSGGLTWSALREDGVTVELRVEGSGRAAPVGWIIKARVRAVLPGIQSAFVDMGLGRDGFLHAADLLLPGDRPARAIDTEDPEDEAPDAEHDRPAPAMDSVPLQDRLKPGRELLVQVARDELSSKGARLTCHVTLPGRHLVYLPQAERDGISRRIVDSEERDRLRAILEEIPRPAGGAFIVRTAGRAVDEQAFLADAALLVESWERIRRDAEGAAAPRVIHQDSDLLLRALRDLPREGVEQIVVDQAADRDRALDYLQRVEPALAARVRLHHGPRPLLEAHDLDGEIDRALRPRVWLESGGYLVIEQTEALVSIDVNTGKFVGRKGLEETVLRTNLEAADEIARQLRLRDLGGIIVIDFIDMIVLENRRRVLEALENALQRDRARTKVVGLSELGLVQLTRKRTRAGLGVQLTRECPWCGGQGRVKTPETVAAEALAEIQRLLPALDGQAVTVRAHPEVARSLRAGILGLAECAEVEVLVEEDPAASPDRFDLRAW